MGPKQQTRTSAKEGKSQHKKFQDPAVRASRVVKRTDHWRACRERTAGN